MKTIKLKINKPIGRPGDPLIVKDSIGRKRAFHPHTVTVQTDDNGVPLERFWRNRLKDAKTDNCVEVIPARTPEVKKEKAE